MTGTRQPKTSSRATRHVPSFRDRSPSSLRSSFLAARSSRKAGSRSEVALAKICRGLRLRIQTNVSDLPGNPDIVVPSLRLVIFCDGDFWHGRNLSKRLARLRVGHNARYWVDKLRSNAARDRRVSRRLRCFGWSVARIWETDVLRAPEKVRRKLLRAMAVARDRAR